MGSRGLTTSLKERIGGGAFGLHVLKCIYPFVPIPLPLSPSLPLALFGSSPNSFTRFPDLQILQGLPSQPYKFGACVLFRLCRQIEDVNDVIVCFYARIEIEGRMFASLLADSLKT